MKHKLMSIDYSYLMDSEEVKRNKLKATLSCFGIFFFVPLLFDAKSKYARFHAGQGLTYLLFLLAYLVIISGLKTVLGAIFLGFIADFIGFIGSLFFLSLLIINLYNVVLGKSKTTWIIGQFNLIPFR